ncbi:sulfatase [Alienimonas sp. DA493]|uniref:sulfatase family protein n=1 Tax=Alienimonas sp. DA493 TaxID=3373605 RepID=UPI003754AC5A
MSAAPLLAALLLGSAPDMAPAAPVNVLWITCEDLSPRLGSYGDALARTPHLDRLAAEGTRYTHAFGVYGVCAPNRFALVTGTYPTGAGAGPMRVTKRTAALADATDPVLRAIPTWEATPPAPVTCFPELLRAAGYYCTNNVKQDYQFTPPVTVWDESSKTAHWRNRPGHGTAGAVPFFSVFNFTSTHESKLHKRTSPAVTDRAAVEVPPFLPDTPAMREDLARQYDNLAELDKQVGALLAELDADGLRENTVVMFFSDHGDGLPRHKRWVYDSGLQVPLIVRFPQGHPDRGEPGTTTDRLVSFVDFAPTVLSLAGIEPPAWMPGPAFLGEHAGEPREYVFAARDRMDPAPETIRAARGPRFKYVRNLRPDLPYWGFVPYRDRAAGAAKITELIEENALGPDQWQLSGTSKPAEELYDTQADPHEIRNLAADPAYADVLTDLRTATERWMERTNDSGTLDGAELIATLWPNGEQPTTATPVIAAADGLITIRCETLGASIGYKLPGDAAWRVYTEPFPAAAGATVRAVAHRIGWKPSQRATLTP